MFGILHRSCNCLQTTLKPPRHEGEAESSRLSLEEEIDEFYFEEKVDKALVVELSDPEGEQDRNSVAGGPIVITCSDDSSDEEVSDMAGKGKSL